MLAGMARAWLLAGSLVLLMAGGSDAPATDFTAKIPAQTGDYPLPALLVILRDLTGLATDVAIVPDAAIDWSVEGNQDVMAIAGDANAITVYWVGGECAARARLTLIAVGSGYELRIREDSTLGGMIGCSAVGIPRMIQVRFSQPISPDLVSVTQTYN
jgi:hypothetical protein